MEEEVRRDVGVSELRRLKQLEDKNRRLKRLVTDLTLDKQMLQDVLSKSYSARCEAGSGNGDADRPTRSRNGGHV